MFNIFLLILLELWCPIHYFPLNLLTIDKQLTVLVDKFHGHLRQRLFMVQLRTHLFDFTLNILFLNILVLDVLHVDYLSEIQLDIFPMSPLIYSPKYHPLGPYFYSHQRTHGKSKRFWR